MHPNAKLRRQSHPSVIKIEKFLLRVSHGFSVKAVFCLLTLMMLAGLTFGLLKGRDDILKQTPKAANGAPLQRGGLATGTCTHAAVRFDPQLSVDQMSRLLRGEDALIVYGPDEFSAYQVRFGTGVTKEDGIRNLQAHPEVKSIVANAQCQ